MLAWVLVIASVIPQEFVAQDRVDLIEVNHYYDERGNPVFDQLIFYDWSSEESRYHVRAWRMLKRKSQWPLRDWERNTFTAVWLDDGKMMRKVRAASIRETWTQYDPELLERAELPLSQRRDLTRTRTPSPQRDSREP